LHGYLERYNTLESIIKKNFPNSQFEISKLDNDFGPAVLEKEVEALVVSEETVEKGQMLNKLRRERQLPPVEIVSVPMILAIDGKRISTSRIKNSEIDAEGNLR
jgi:pantetheine-phosphate adenylyltransferase